MTNGFYADKDTDFKYPEIGICMEDSTGPTVKISIPIATPTLPLDSIYDNKDLKPNTNNIVSSQTAMYISPCTVSNYIEISLPKEIESIKRGDKVILLFIGGDINNPIILRRYE